MGKDWVDAESGVSRYVLFAARPQAPDGAPANTAARPEAGGTLRPEALLWVSPRSALCSVGKYLPLTLQM